MNRPCLDCGTPSPRTRCCACEAKRQSVRNAGRPQYRGDWQRVRAQVKARWVAAHGWWCPGYEREAHASTDLTVDHRHDGSRGVLCRPCNASKGKLDPVFVPAIKR